MSSGVFALGAIVVLCTIRLNSAALVCNADPGGDIFVKLVAK